MKVVHLVAGGNAYGGIETLLLNYSLSSNQNNVFVLANGEGAFSKKLDANNIGYHSLDLKRKNYLSFLRNIMEVIEKEKPDAIVAHHAMPELRYVCYMLRKKYPVYIYHHSNAIDQNERKGIKKNLVDFIYRIAITNATSNIAISHSVQNSVIEYYKSSKIKMDVVYNGIDVKSFLAPIHQVEDTIHFIYIGRLSKKKGVHVTLEALSLLPIDRNWDFTIVGDGEYRNDLELLASRYKINNKVHFLGRSDKVKEYLANSDVFIHSCTWEEGFGLSIVEAMAAGKLCVCSNVGAIPEIIDNGKNGMLFETENARELTGIINRIISSSNGFTALQKQAQIDAERFSLDNYISEIEKIYCGNKL